METQAEHSLPKQHLRFITDSKVDKAQKTTDSEHKTAKRQNQEQALTVKSGDLEGTQKELDAALVTSGPPSSSFCLSNSFQPPLFAATYRTSELVLSKTHDEI